jgi:hypothetical protein
MLRAIVLACVLLSMGRVATAEDFTPSKFASTITVHAQAGALDLPGEPVSGDTHGRYFIKLVWVASKRDVGVAITDLTKVFPKTKNLWGYYTGWEEKRPRLLIHIKLPVNQMVATLAHELGHHLQGDKLEDNEGQIWAETFAFLVCNRIGLDTWKSSATYLAQFPEYDYVMRKHEKTILQFVDEVVKELK